MHIITKIQKMPSAVKVAMLVMLDVIVVIIGYFLSLYFENIGFDLSEHPIRNTILAPKIFRRLHFKTNVSFTLLYIYTFPLLS